MVLWILLAGLAVMIIAAAVQLILVAMGTEAFTATSTIRKPPYTDSETRRIYSMLSPASRTALLARAKTANPTLRDPQDLAALEVKAGAMVTPAVASFFTTVFEPRTTTLKAHDVKAFMAARPATDIAALEEEAVTAYFLGQTGIHVSGFLDVLSNMNMSYTAQPLAGRPGTGTPGTPGFVPVGAPAAAASAASASTGTAPTTTTTATGTTTTATGTPVAGPGGPASGSAAGAGTVAGPQNPLFGPPFTSLGDGPLPASSGDSSAFTSYPQVFGGVAGATSVAGPAVRNADGSLPTAQSAGATEQAQFFPFSRTPGDMEVIPDPFRVSQTFSASNYSSKTDPVPFLADFSAFQS